MLCTNYNIDIIYVVILQLTQLRLKNRHGRTRGEFIALLARQPHLFCTTRY
uniref:Uncharacterized protein n=1 Tax=Arundo donax TaxID=35708 RepID=A0A0A8ZBE9_ARUDO